MTEAASLFDDGRAYERLMGRWSRLAGEQFLDWLDAPANLKWIDIGCGNGAFTELLIARSAPLSVMGIDPSEGQIAFARTRPGAKLAEFRICDAQALPFPDSSFDAASMALVISFLRDPNKAAAEMARVVRRGGIVATYMWDFLDGGGTPLTPLGVAIQSLGLPPLARPNPEASRRETLRKIWEQAGLRSVETKAIRIRISFSNFDDYWTSNSLAVGPSGKALAEMSAEQREQVKARLREQLPIAADGTIAYDAVANAVKGIA
jgi:ubiquinone/menaquinone biosynthesis C-methylase UbiE